MTAADTPFPRAEVIALGAAMSLTVGTMTLIVPVIPDYAVHFDVSLTAAAAMVSVFAAARLVFRFPGGMGADRWGARSAASTAAVIVAAGALAAALAPEFWVVLAGRAVQGIGVAIFGVSANQHLLVITPREHLGRATAIFQTGIVSGAAAGPFVGGVLADWGDLRTPFWAQAVLGLVLIPVVWSAMDDAVAAPRTVRASLRSATELLRRPLFVGVMATGFALFFMRAGARNALLPAYAGAVGGLSPTAIGAVVSASSITSVAAMVPIGRLVDAWGRRPVVIAGGVAAAGSVALYGTTSSLWGLLGISAVTGLTVGLASIPLPTMVGDLAPRGSEGIASGVFRMGNDVGWIAGPLALGAMADAGEWALGFVLAGVPLVVAGLFFLRAPETGTGVRGLRREPGMLRRDRPASPE
jgi:MFS family permease